MRTIPESEKMNIKRRNKHISDDRKKADMEKSISAFDFSYIIFRICIFRRE